MSDTEAVLSRRMALGGAAALLAAGGAAAQGRRMPGEGDLYGRVGKLTAQLGRRAELIAILAEGTGGMPGCLGYIIAEDRGDPDAIWITEVWRSQQDHAASLRLAAVRDAIRRGRPLIAGFETGAETRPLAGVGLPG